MKTSPRRIFGITLLCAIFGYIVFVVISFIKIENITKERSARQSQSFAIAIDKCINEMLRKGELVTKETITECCAAKKYVANPSGYLEYTPQDMTSTVIHWSAEIRDSDIRVVVEDECYGSRKEWVINKLAHPAAN